MSCETFTVSGMNDVEWWHALLAVGLCSIWAVVQLFVGLVIGDAARLNRVTQEEIEESNGITRHD